MKPFGAICSRAKAASVHCSKKARIVSPGRPRPRPTHGARRCSDRLVPYTAAQAHAQLLPQARFIPGSRVIAYVTAGVLRIKFPRFAASLAIAAAVWTPILVSIAYFAGTLVAPLSLGVLACLADLFTSHFLWWLPRAKASGQHCMGDA